MRRFIPAAFGALRTADLTLTPHGASPLLRDDLDLVDDGAPEVGGGGAAAGSSLSSALGAATSGAALGMLLLALPAARLDAALVVLDLDYVTQLIALCRESTRDCCDDQARRRRSRVAVVVSSRFGEGARVRPCVRERVPTDEERRPPSLMRTALVLLRSRRRHVGTFSSSSLVVVVVVKT